MGRKLAGFLGKAGFEAVRELTLPDAELAFSGPAPFDVLDVWRARFARMKALQEYCGADFEQVRDEFMDCLSNGDHCSLATVRCCIAVRDGDE